MSVKSTKSPSMGTKIRIAFDYVLLAIMGLLFIFCVSLAWLPILCIISLIVPSLWLWGDILHLRKLDDHQNKTPQRQI